MAIAHVQSNEDNIASGTGDTLAYGSGVTAGSLLVMSFRLGDPGSGPKTVTVSDDINGSWTEVPSSAFTGGSGQVGQFYFPNAGSGTTTVTIAISGAATSIRWAIHEFSGVATTSPLEQHNASTFSIGEDGPDVTTVQANQVIFVSIGVNTAMTITAGTGYTLGQVVPDSPSARFATEYQIVAAATTYTGDFNLDGDTASQSVISSFLEAAAGGRTTKNTRGFTHGVNVGMGHRMPV
jgi:hypothetical protein